MGERRKDIEKDFEWTEKRIMALVTYGNLNKDEENIWRSRLKNQTITQQCAEFNMSASKVSRIIKRVKRIYDAVQADYPELEFPVRRESETEKYMDEH